MLLATLPAIHQEELLYDMINHPLVYGVRYNIGAVSPYPPKETLERILVLTKEAGKKLWVDLKGRQLRITNWADPNYAKIELNHEIEVEGDALVFFRGNEWSNLSFANGRVILVDPQPINAVGKGQAINIVGGNLKIKGFLTPEDIEYINAACDLGIFDFMLSFVEKREDIDEVKSILLKHPNFHETKTNYEFVLKIESIPGIDFMKSLSTEDIEGLRIMVARDDLMINIGPNKARILDVLERAINIDKNAIAASHLFSGLEGKDIIGASDITDIYLLHTMGYKTLLLSDWVCQRRFDEAIEAWGDYKEIYP